MKTEIDKNYVGFFTIIIVLLFAFMAILIFGPLGKPNVGWRLDGEACVKNNECMSKLCVNGICASDVSSNSPPPAPVAPPPASVLPALPAPVIDETIDIEFPVYTKKKT